MDYDVIAIIRGGGAGLEALDEVELLETLVNMNTAWMYGAGHEGEKLFILNIADKAIAAKNGRYPPTQNGDIRSLLALFILMALQN